MNIHTVGHTMEYEAEQIALLFFPNHEGVTIESTLTCKEGNFSARTLVTVCDRTNVHTETAAFIKPSPRDLGNLIKRSAFFAMRPLSPLPAPWGILTGVRPTKLIQILRREGRTEEEVRALLETEYLVEADKIRLALAVASEEEKYVPCASDVCVYISIPFCPTRCTYCSFISGTGAASTHAEYVSLLCKEIEKTGQIIRDMHLRLRAIYIGGGTPTSLSAPLLETLFSCIRESFSPPHGLEFTTEAGRPDTITAEKLEVLKRYETNRISINPQTLHDETLRRIGRRHTAKQFTEAFALARSMGFSNINTDLIAGLPGEDVSMFRSTFDAITALSPESITVHTLYLKRASSLRQSGTPVEATDTASMLRYASLGAFEKGYLPYYMYRQKATVGNLENVGYAKEGTASFYNTVTMTDCANIFALGAGGVSRLLLPDKVVRVFNYKHDDAYCHDFDTILRRKEEFYKIQA